MNRRAPLMIPQLPAEAGVVQTMGLLRALANQAAGDPRIVNQARAALSLAAHPAEAIARWVRQKVRYTPDAEEAEEITHPSSIALAIDAGMIPAGDCDDMVGYAAALLRALGLHPYMEVVGQGDQYHHVFLSLDGRRIDPTVSEFRPPFPATRWLRLEV